MSISAMCLGLCQFLFMAAAAVSIAFNALVGKQLAPTAELSTLPFLAMMGATTALTLLMPRALSRLGYKGVFCLGAIVGAAGCALAALGVWRQDFWIFCCATLLIGVYQASALYYRFAAADAVQAPFKSAAMAWVLSGGIAAALFGPMIGKYFLHSLSVEFAGAYLAAAALCAFAVPVLLLAPLPKRQINTYLNLAVRPLPKAAIQAFWCCAMGYCLMLMVMLASPLAMASCGFHAGDAASVIQWHLLGMFAPSLMTGKWITRFGANAVAWAGAVILALGCAIALINQSLLVFHAALFIVGLGWNFMYMGGSTLLSQISDPAVRSRLQSINEFITFSSVTIVSGLTGWVYIQLGWEAILVMGIVMLAGLFVINWRIDNNN